jgi:hypothetical protein
VPREGSLTPGSIPTSLARADLVFRLAGAGALALLAATAVLLALDVEAWRPVFAFAHLAALIALAPLGVWRRHREVVVLLVVVTITVAVSLMNFQDGIRWLRRVANLTTVALVLVLVARYLSWRREAFRP